MPTEKHTTVTGEIIEYPRPTGELATFMARLVDATNDPHVSEAELLDLIYGKANPLLDQSIFPNHGAVTKAVFANPTYHVMQDLLGRKRVQAGTLDLEEVRGAATMSVAEAAAELGATPAGVRKAIREKRLAAVKVGRGYHLDPRDVATFKRFRRARGPDGAPALKFCMGSTDGKSFRIRAPGLRITKRDGRLMHGEVSSFRKAAVTFSGKTGNRMFVLEPAEANDRFDFGPFFIEGRYRVTEKVNEPGEASERFKAFRVERTEADRLRRLEEVPAILEEYGLTADEGWDGDVLALWPNNKGQYTLLMEKEQEVSKAVAQKLKKRFHAEGFDFIANGRHA